MTVRSTTLATNADGTGSISWLAITEADEGTPAAISNWPLKTVQVVGDFTTAGAITMQGSNDGGTTYNTLKDIFGVDLVITDSKPRFIAENPILIKPKATAGTAVSMDVYIGLSQAVGPAISGYLNDNLSDAAPKMISNVAATLVNNTTIFTIAGGAIQIEALLAVCKTDNDGTASTLRWSHDPTDGVAATFSGISPSLASALAGAVVSLDGTALTTIPPLVASGGALGLTRPIILQPGLLTTTIASGPTTGTWQHVMRYRPLASGVTVS